MDAARLMLADRIRDEGARLAAACTACGECVRACPMTPYAAGVDAAPPGEVAAGMVEVLQGGAGTVLSLAWIGACTKSGVCTPACPEGLEVALMLKFAQMRAKGALGEPARIPVREDTQFSPRVKAFARLSMTEEEQARWL